MNNSIICGIDEVGRGPLAGPVVSAAVILPDGHKIEGLGDSKKISPIKRKALFDEIITISDIGVGIVTSREIDNINILQATYVSMEKAYSRLKSIPDKTLVDGYRIPTKKFISEGIIKGDEKIQEISAASIIAKVVRDKFMILVDSVFPQFEFSKHKGYGTSVHMNALIKHKATLIHRKSFKPVKNNLPTNSMMKNQNYKKLLNDQKKELKKLNKEIKNWLSKKNLIY